MAVATASARPSVAEFYRGKNVFITGGTGFIGKMMVEKLLRSCPDVGTIYLLARPKKNKSAEERIGEMTNVPLFDAVRQHNPAALGKIALIEGDVSLVGLGMSAADQQLFCERINVIIHSAATISFTEPLKVAIATNLQSVKELLKLARRTKQLDSFVHVSTAYTNWFRLNVGEEFYKPKYDPNEVIDMCRTLSDEELTKKIPTIEPHNNTYTFSKSLAEYLVWMEAQDLPAAVIRPSIVAGSVSEPFPGWVDNWAGPTLFGFMTAKGMLRNLEMRGDYVIETVPADTVVNMTLAAAYDVGTDKSARKAPPMIYNCSTGTRNPVYFDKFFKSFAKHGRKYPLSDVVWYPNLRLWKSAAADKAVTLLTQLIPSYLGDFALRLAGKKPRLVKAQTLTLNSYKDSKFAANNPILFQTDNTSKLMAALSQSDLKKFDFDVRRINWDKFCEDYFLGIRKYVVKDKSENFPALRRRVAAFRYAGFLFMGAVGGASSLYVFNKLGKSTEKKSETVRDRTVFAPSLSFG